MFINILSLFFDPDVILGGYNYGTDYYVLYYYYDDENYDDKPRKGPEEVHDSSAKSPHGVLPPPKPALKSIEETKPPSKVKPAPKVHGHKRRLGSDNDGGYGAYVLSSSTF
jgi:hypothetical protein